MTFDEFRNGLCILRSIDRHEMVEAGCIQDTDIHRWPSFRDGPYDWLLVADDTTAEKLWALMESRGVNRHQDERDAQADARLQQHERGAGP